jgi:4-aminobutyrate aminotransferase-like enzyme/Ser/Thr protein kinase RdoA (MazF antagonist)
VSTADVEALAAAAFGIEGTAVPLHGEVDLNYRLDADGGRSYLLKLPAPESDPAALDLATHALEHLAGRPSSPLVPALAGRADEPQPMRLLGWIPGRPWAEAGPAGPERLRELGRAVAAVDADLADFEDPDLDRPLRWNLASAAEQRGLAAFIADDDRRGRVRDVLDRFAETVAPRLHELPAQAIHNDANEHNVVVGDDGHVAGLVDFGDLCRAPRVCGLAVACAYAMTALRRPAVDVLASVSGYHEVAPLTPAELELLDDLIRTRLALSVAMAAWQSAERPANAPYLHISQASVWPLLERLSAEPRGLATLRFRDACGYDAVPSGRAVRDWLLAHADPGPVLAADVLAGEPPVLDWSRGSPSAGEGPPVPLAVGRYLEERAVYDSPAFAVDGTDERRTVHLGLDLFAAAGEPVTAPLDGVVLDAAYRPERCDFGGTVLLGHETGDGVPFATLYGHLSRASAERLAAGDHIGRGQLVGHLGAEEENGGWAPHLHLQVVCDDLGLGSGFPGVAPPSELGVWESLSPHPNLLLGLAAGLDALPPVPRAELRRRRRTSLSPALSLSYDEPLEIVGGHGARLVEAGGREYIDLVNNVAHVGHAHPRVVAALSGQAARLNTNTRYLHPALVTYARRLAAMFPDPLSVVFLVNSGSEANDLALRLAHAHTGRRGILVLEGAYHGHLTSLIDISPAKFGGPGGEGAPPHVGVCALPDPYRGRLRTGSPNLGEAYAAGVARQIAALRERGHEPSAFVAESLPGVAGQIELPAGYLAAAYRHVRAAGGVCVADEVQVGFGRVGTHVWGFETQGVVPDVVTLGKPIGNGHPLGAVVTSPSAARSFLTGMEYFNTFGGNPVSCAAGLAVLDVLRDERLQARAARVGGRLADGLRTLAERHSLIGDVRGRGLFLGVDLVRDRERRTPATEEAARVVNLARAEGVLLSTDGPGRNVLKIKPPLVLEEADAERALAVIDEALAAVETGVSISGDPFVTGPEGGDPAPPRTRRTR